jgi:3-oxoacyl-[acyl-carrier-protein] synthase II
MALLKLFADDRETDDDFRVAVTGVGMVCSVGRNREEVWRALQRGEQGVKLRRNIAGISGLDLPVAGCDWIDLEAPTPERAIAMAKIAAKEALEDCELELQAIDRSRFAVSTSAHFGDTQFIRDQVYQSEPSYPWWNCWLPNAGCVRLADHFQLGGLRLCHSTACASSLISIIMAVRQLQDHQCDFVLAGGMEAVQPLMASAFQRMGVLAPGGKFPESACKPFDRSRNGFVLGEGSAMLVLERSVDAKRRGAKIYGEIVAAQLLSEASHVTSLDENAASLSRLLHLLLRRACWRPEQVDYINAHGTGTEQNDRNELTAVEQVFGQIPSQLAMSSIKGMIGHTINAAGSLELATTLLAIRDGYRPGTRNLVERESIGGIDCLAEMGTRATVDHAIKMSVAFGGHLAALAVRKSPTAAQRPMSSLDPSARIRSTAATSDDRCSERMPASLRKAS